MAVAVVSAGTLLAGIFTGGTASATNFSGPVTDFESMCLDDAGNSQANFNPVQIYDCNDSLAQLWTYNDESSTLKLYNTNKCLDVHGGATANGTTVDIYDCNNTGAQKWVPRANFTLYNPQSGKCLDVPNWAYTPTQLIIWDCTSMGNQYWKLGFE